MPNNGPTGARVLVTGATGNNGRRVVRELHDDPGPENVTVVAAVRDPAKAAEFTSQGIETAALDLDDVDSVRAAVRGVDRLFLMAGYTVEMLRQSKIVVDAADEAGVEHIVHLGAMAPADTDLPQFGWHLYVERYIAASRLGCPLRGIRACARAAGRDAGPWHPRRGRDPDRVRSGCRRRDP